MSVTSCTLDRTTLTGSIDHKGKRTYTAQWLVRTSDDGDGPAIVLSQGIYVGPNALPFPGTYYEVGDESDAGAWFRKATPTRDPQCATLWRVRVEWGPPEKNENPQEDSESDPVERSPKYWIETESYSQIFTEDLEGNKVVNSANQPFREPLVEQLNRSVLVYQFNVRNFFEAQQIVDGYKDAINASTFLGRSRDTVRCTSIATSLAQQENGYNYYTVTMRFTARNPAERPATWLREVWDRGDSYLDGAELKPLTDGNDNILDEGNLDGNGGQLGADQDPVTLKFRTLRRANFNQIVSL